MLATCEALEECCHFLNQDVAPIPAFCVTRHEAGVEVACYVTEIVSTSSCLMVATVEDGTIIVFILNSLVMG